MKDSEQIYTQYDEINFEDESGDVSLSFDEHDFSDVVIWGTDWTLETVCRQVSKGNIDLEPKFQRRDAWNKTQKSSLIESFVIGMPVPSIVLAEKKNDKGKYLVIDGKQRLLTICQFCDDSGQFDELRLVKNMDILKEIGGKTYKELNSDLSRYRNMFDNQTIRTIVVRNWPNENFLYTLFLRLNIGTLKLSTQELRQALNPGDFLNFLDEATSDSKQFHKLLKNEKADPRMRDIELALRSFAWRYYASTYTGNFKEFLDDTCKKLNEYWKTREQEIREYFEEIEEAINFAITIFPDRAFSKPTGRYAFNKAIYDVIIFYFSFKDIRDKITTEGLEAQFANGFNTLCEDAGFSQSITTSFSLTKNVTYRFDKVRELINTVTGLSTPTLGID